MTLKKIITISLLIVNFIAYGQGESDEGTRSNIQEFTPSKLLNKGQWDLKWFNGLYTQTRSTFTEGEELRQTFFTSTIEVFTNFSKTNRFNVGIIVEARSNVIGGRDALDVFKFDSDANTARSGLTSIAPSVKIAPFKSISNFSIQSAFHIPFVDNETENNVFLDQKGFTWQNRFFYDYTFTGDKFQLFTELNSEYHFGKKEDSFANNSLNLSPGVFLSYFPSQKFTVLCLAQYSQRIDLGNDFAQNYTAIGGGAKYQLTKKLNVEALYTNFVDGKNTGLGQSFNFGLRALL